MVDTQGRVLRVIARTEKHRKLSEETTRLVPGDPHEVEIVKWIYDEYSNGRKGFSLIAGELNARRVGAPSGGVWISGTVRELLTNRVYVGDLVWNKETSAKFFKVVGRELAKQDRMHTSRLTGKRTGYSANPEHEHLVFPDNHPALIDREMFERAQQVMRARADRLDERGGIGGHWSERRHLLTGLIFCSCGARMNALPATVKGRVYRRYACVGYQRSRTCKPYWVSPAVLERALIRVLAGALEGDALKSRTMDAVGRQLVASGQRATRAAIDRAMRVAKELLSHPERMLALVGREATRTFLEQSLARVTLRFETLAVAGGQTRELRKLLDGKVTTRAAAASAW